MMASPAKFGVVDPPDVARRSQQPPRDDAASGSSESDIDTPLGFTSSAAHSPGSLSSSSRIPSVGSSPTPPRLSRAFSMPLPFQLGLLQNPHKSNTQQTPSPTIAGPHTGLHSLSVELADAFQMIIQTLVQVAPPHLLDPAKEQVAACFLSLPTASMSSLLTSMKNLNYMAANALPLTIGGPPFIPQINDFDIGEMLQAVGDAVSGIASQAGIDLVLYHGDVGMKHVNVCGDECGLSCALSHIVRQLISGSEPGDTIEIGLFVSYRDLTEYPGSVDDSQAPHKHLSAQFDITHKFGDKANTAIPGNDGYFSSTSRPIPHFQSTILHGLIAQTKSKFIELPHEPMPVLERRYRLAVPLQLANNTDEVPQKLTPEEETMRQPFSNVRLANEPSLAELRQFAETLRGKKVAFHASSSGAFANRLTSYLTSWGMDISHISIDKEDPASPVEHMDNEWRYSTANDKPLIPMPVPDDSTPSLSNSNSGSSSDSNVSSFIIIDDDVVVLRRRIAQLRIQNRTRMGSSKRPALIHRPKSSPHLRTFISSPSRHHPGSNIATIHFTSIANYKLVRDLIQSMTEYSSGSGSLDIIAIPKPAGPRRFLTALYTAVVRPFVDPLFSPIATSPSSPSNFEALQTPLSIRHGNSKATDPKRDRGPRSPRESGSGSYLGTASPLVVEMEADDYFPDTAQRLGSSPASGVLIQSPDGQPAIYFQPKPRLPRQASGSRSLQRDNQWQPQESTKHPTRSPGSEGTLPVRSKQQPPRTSDLPRTADEPATDEQEDKAPSSEDKTESPVQSKRSIKSPKRTSVGETFGRVARPLNQPLKKTKTNDNSVVPPINVLIVEDNPINQTILSTFMKRKRIKFDTAADGLQAIEKYKEGNFHLILMDIQMPNMNGIEATKRIREIEACSNKASLDTSNGTTRGPTSGSSAIIVALTASSLAADRVNALAAGCNDFLTKPVSLLWLNNKIIEWGSLKVLQMWATATPRNLPAQQAQSRREREHRGGRQAAIESSESNDDLNVDQSKQGLCTLNGRTKVDAG